MDRRSKLLLIPTSVGTLAGLGLGQMTNVLQPYRPDAPHWVFSFLFWSGVALTVLPLPVWLIWAGWKSRKRLSRQVRMLIGLGLMICGCAIGVVGMSIIAAGESPSPSDDQSKSLAQQPRSDQTVTTKPAFDIGGAGNISASDIKLCGEMTIIKSQPGSTGSMDLKGFTGIAPNTKCSFPPPTEAMKGLSNKELKDRAKVFSAQLLAFDARYNDQTKFRMNDHERQAFDQRWADEFKSFYLQPAMELNSAIAAKTGWIDIPDTKPNEQDVVKAQNWSALTRHGRATLIFGKPIGLEPATGVSNYLTFIADKLQE